MCNWAVNTGLQVMAGKNTPTNCVKKWIGGGCSLRRLIGNADNIGHISSMNRFLPDPLTREEMRALMLVAIAPPLRGLSHRIQRRLVDLGFAEPFAAESSRPKTVCCA
jgi:hypothetical protein